MPSQSGERVTWSDEPGDEPRTVPFTKRREIFLKKEIVTPLSTFEKVVGDDFFVDVARQMNVYARAHERSPDPGSHMQKWHDVTVQELQMFFGILEKKATYPSFWSTYPFFHNTFFSKSIKRDRFRLVFSFLHLVDNSGEATSNDKLFKIRPFIQTISANFKTLFYPGKQLNLDEETCPYKGRWSGVTYNPNKPHKWGIKLYQLCDAVTGYCCKFRIAAEESMATRSVVLDLVHNYLFAGHEVYMGRYYTSIPLFQDLFAQRTVAVGTIMGNRRGLPKDLIQKKLGKGEVAARRHGAFLVLKWRDRRDVLVLSTRHTPAMQDVLVRVPGGRVVKSKPMAVQEYNDYMSGVHKSNQLLQYYSMNRKTVKWWKKFFFHFCNYVL